MIAPIDGAIAYVPAPASPRIALAVRALCWSVRRELWEHRWVYRVPLLLAAVLITVFSGALLTSHDASTTFDHLSRMLLISGTILAMFYCGEALHGERRDRSILFWKSLPVSDGIAVGAKAIVALVVIPLMTLAALLIGQLVAMLLLATTSAPLAGPLSNALAVSGEVFATTLWNAPLYGWILLVSAWARRAVLVWAILPFVLMSMIERIATRSTAVSDALFQRGPQRHLPARLGSSGINEMSAVPAAELLRQPALWAGVALAFLLVVLAIQERRRQRPL